MQIPRELLALAASALAAVAATAPVRAAQEGPAVQVAAANGTLRPFEAGYHVSYRGIGVGHSTLRLSRAADDVWVYESENRARGLARLAFPDPITQISRFRLHDGVAQPLEYANDDGSRSTERDVRLKFDWVARQVSGVAEDRPVALPLPPGTQDALSVQITLMLELAAGRPPASFLLIDKNEIKKYQYEREGEETLDTPLGQLPTVRFRSQGAGSSRVTRLWLAPSLGYLPVRAEQRRGTRVDFALEIERVSLR